MAEIPSEIASSSAQTGFQAREVGIGRAGRLAAQASAANREIKSIDESGTTVDTDDAETQVYADAEGTGSQGRPFEEEQGEEGESPAEADRGVTTDDDGRLHLDLEA